MEKIKIKKWQVFFVVCMAAMLAFSLLGCGSLKSKVKSDVKVNQVTTSKVDSAVKLSIETKHYGDTLKVKNFIPIGDWLNQSVAGIKDSTKGVVPVPPFFAPKTFTTSSESKGIKHIQRFTPIYNHSGLIGLSEEDTTIAKPTSTTNTHEDKSATVRTTTVKDSTAKVHSNTTNTFGLGLPSWLYWVFGIGILIGLIFLTKKFI